MVFNTLVTLQIIAILVIIIALVYMFRSGSTYTHVLMLAFLAAEMVHSAGYLLELLSKTRLPRIQSQLYVQANIMPKKRPKQVFFHLCFSTTSFACHTRNII